MLSTDLERLITVKRREIEQEKTLLGLTPPPNNNTVENNTDRVKSVTFTRPRAYSENDTTINVAERDEGKTTDAEEKSPGKLDGDIPPDLERYIRRYLGLPVMLKAGEFSPNNPLIRAERTAGDALLGLGEYERRRNTLRKIQQKQYREYLDQQAKKKQEAKEQAERERREREEKEKLEEERERQRQELERERSPERRRASYKYLTGANNNSYVTKVDTGVQVDYRSAPLSVAVQTDGQLYTPNQRISNLLTQAERELSPHTAEPRHTEPPGPWPQSWVEPHWGRERRRSCGDFERSNEGRACARDKVHTVPRYQPSILDGDAIKLRNELAEKEAAERRRFHQRELRDQILEQQRLRTERTARERLLEQAGVRRLEEQLRSLQLAQARGERGGGRQRVLLDNMKESASEYNMKRNTLQREIDAEQKLLLKSRHAADVPRASARPQHHKEKRPYSINIPENSIFSHNYDVDSYLRRNLNPTKESLISNTFENEDRLRDLIGEKVHEQETKLFSDLDSAAIRDLCTERPLRNDRDAIREPKVRSSVQEFAKMSEPKEAYLRTKYPIENKLNTIGDKSEDTLPIPVLRHSPKRTPTLDEPDSNLSDAMRMVDDKWRVPVVQKNILKSLPNEGGKPVSILTQLGSIRRQLQMEQLKLDKMLSKSNKL